jgi:hypothetical protein
VQGSEILMQLLQMGWFSGHCWSQLAGGNGKCREGRDTFFSSFARVATLAGFLMAFPRS